VFICGQNLPRILERNSWRQKDAWQKNENWTWGDRNADLVPRMTHIFAPHIFAIHAVGEWVSTTRLV
jgi:hypothetical protein